MRVRRATMGIVPTLVFCLTVPSRSQIVNGDFGTGDFSGWTVIAEDQSLMPIDPLVKVVATDGGFAANWPTGEFADGVFVQFVEQSFSVDPLLPLLTFDISTAEWSPDPTGKGTAAFNDELFVTVGPNPLEQIEPILVDRVGLLIDPIGTASGLVELSASENANGFHGVTVDLSSFSSRDVLLSIDTIQQDDDYKLDSLLIGNFAMRPVPEPTSGRLVCVIGFLMLARRRFLPI